MATLKYQITNYFKKYKLFLASIPICFLIGITMLYIFENANSFIEGIGLGLCIYSMASFLLTGYLWFLEEERIDN